MINFIFPILISILWIFYRSNQYFEDKMYYTPQVKAVTSQVSFFLPYPKNFELISEYQEKGYEVKIINTVEDISSLNSFYQEILRSKNFQKDFEYENENSQEFKYSKEREEINIILNRQDKGTSVIFRHFN